jgi:hypothetical protein
MSVGVTMGTQYCTKKEVDNPLLPTNVTLDCGKFNLKRGGTVEREGGRGRGRERERKREREREQ